MTLLYLMALRWNVYAMWIMPSEPCGTSRAQANRADDDAHVSMQWQAERREERTRRHVAGGWSHRGKGPLRTPGQHQAQVKKEKKKKNCTCVTHGYE